MTPLGIEMMLHYSYTRIPFPNEQYESQQKLRAEFLAIGLLAVIPAEHRVPGNADVAITTLGKDYTRRLTEVPLVPFEL